MHVIITDKNNSGASGLSVKIFIKSISSNIFIKNIYNGLSTPLLNKD
jgi:hypothetical protein